MNREQLANGLGALVHSVVEARHASDKRFLPGMLLGASFEGWLAFETRFALEKRRDEFDLADPSIWIGNEYRKVDLGVVRYANALYEGREDWLAAIEFKVVYNNKNWPAQVRGILADLDPAAFARTAKASLAVREQQFAVVALMHSNVPSNKYQRETDRKENRDAWVQRVREALKVGCGVTEYWQSPQRLEAPHHLLAEGTVASLTFHVLGPS